MHVFLEISLVIALATAMAFVMQWLKQPLILGHILTGIIAGPAFLNLVQSRDTFEVFSKLGITTLLFIVGLNLSPRIMREVGRVSLTAGLGQVVFTTLAGFGLCLLLGFGWKEALFIGTALTFSSTIIATKLLSDKKDLGKLYGKITIGILLVQDLVATIILICFSASQQTHDFGAAVLLFAGKLVLVGFGLALFASVILPRLSKSFAQSQEFLMLFSVGWGVGVAALFQQLGLSMEIGALTAGVSLASSPYHYEISAKMRLLRDFFIVIFFILLGSQLTLSNISQLLVPVLVLSAFVLIGNPLIVMLILALNGYHKKVGFLTGLSVAQVSEFSLLLVVLGVQVGFVSSNVLSLVTLVALVTIALSTAASLSSERLYRLLEPLLKPFDVAPPPHEGPRERYDVLLFGCHRLGTSFVHDFAGKKMKALCIDYDPAMVAELNARGVAARYGDAQDAELLEELNLAKAKLVISTVPDADTNLFLLEKVRHANAKTPVIIIAHTIDEALLFYKHGASYVILPHAIGGNHASVLISRHGFDHRKYSTERVHHIKHLQARRQPEAAGIGALARP